MDHSMLEAMHEGRTYQRVELITGGRRRRNWTAEEKARIVAESAAPNANISDVARRNGVSRGLLTVWRRQAWEARSTSDHEALFASVRVRCVEERPQNATAITEENAAVSVACGAIEVSFADATCQWARTARRSKVSARLAPFTQQA
jgi:transposase